MEFLSNKFLLIALAEFAAVLVVLCLILFMRNRKLNRLMGKLQARMEQLVQEIKKARNGAAAIAKAPPAAKDTKDPAPTVESPAEESYLSYLNQQIEQTLEHHAALGADSVISQDLDPETPMHRRAAALRHAVLLTEKETCASRRNKTNWELLQGKYEQILHFYDDYTSSAEGAVCVPENAEIDTLAEELKVAKKRIVGLEKFKTLYMELEGQWEQSQSKAKGHMEELNILASETEHRDEFSTALKDYDQSYQDIGSLIEGGIEGLEIVTVPTNSENDSSGEIRHLRKVASERLTTIEELQSKLDSLDMGGNQEKLVNSLKEELEKQMRFVQESETCIKLMEEELSNAHTELEQVKTRVNQVPRLKAELKDVREEKDKYELQVYSLKSEARKLAKELKSREPAPSTSKGGGDAEETASLKKRILELESQYANLEEKYLDLKIQ